MTTVAYAYFKDRGSLNVEGVLEVPENQAPAGAIPVQGWVGVTPPAPTPEHILRINAANELYWFDPRSLDDLKKAKNSEINSMRLAANQRGFTFAGKLVSTDTLSRGDIDGTNGTVALTGNFPDNWPGYWKSEDNSLIPITTVEEWKLFYAAMSAQGAINFGIAQQLKAQLALAQSPEQVAEIVWP